MHHPSHASTFRRLAAAAVTAMALAGFAPAAWSQAPTEASIDTLLTITRSEQLIDTAKTDVERQMRASIQASLRGRQPTAQEQQTIDGIVRDASALVRQEMDWADLRPPMVEIYRRTFTQEEVDGLVAFYRTPIGAAVVDKMPAVMQGTSMLVQQRLATMMPKLQALVQKRVAESRAATGAAAPAVPAAPAAK